MSVARPAPARALPAPAWFVLGVVGGLVIPSSALLARRRLSAPPQLPHREEPALPLIATPADPPPMRPRSGRARFVRIAAFWVPAGIAAGLALAIAAPFARGGGAFTVLSGSMEPVLHTGDVVLAERIAPAEARVGDVISFRDPDGSGRLITHRVRSIQVRGRTVRLVTKGDAANGLQRWSVPTDGSVGRVRFRVWKLGYALGWLHGLLGRLLLVVAPVLALAISTLVRIWRSPSRPLSGSRL